MFLINKIQIKKYYLAAAVSLITLLQYIPSLKHEFLGWDDNQYVYENPFISSFGIDFFKWAFLDFHSYNWHPLTWISLALDYSMWGLDPMGYHLTNIILHTANTIMVVLLVVRLLASWQADKLTSPHDARISLIAAVTTGLLFGIHPIHVESVAWVSERKDLLCGLFFLLSIMAYMMYKTPPTLHLDKEGREEGLKGVRGKWYFHSLGFFTLALLSKPMAVTLPVVLLVLDWYPLRRIISLKTFFSVFIEKLPFFALSIISSLLTIFAQRSGDAIKSLEFSPLSTRVLVAGKSLAAYLWKMILPLELIPFYPYPQDASFFSLEYVSAIAVVSGITIVCLVVAKKHRLWLSVWGYYVITLLPVLGIVQVGIHSMADRYSYLPSLGPFLVTGILVAWVLERVNDLGKLRHPVKIIIFSMLISVFAYMSFLTFRQITIWENSITLWNYLIKKEPERVPFAYYNRGIAFEKRGETDKAIEDYDMAIALKPSYYEAYNNRGIALNRIGQTGKAIEDYDRAIALKPSHYEAYYNRARVFEKTGEFDRAIADYNNTIKFNPEYVAAYVNRGIAYFLLRNYDGALEDFNKAILLNPAHSVAYLNRGTLYLVTGYKNLAVSDFRIACDLGNNNGCNALRAF